MPAKTLREVVERYFAAQNASNGEAVVALFAADGEVYNVNQPRVGGHDGILAFCNGLYARTEARHFDIVTLLEGPDIAMAEWQATLHFREGAQIGPWQLAEGFAASLRGVNKFEFDSRRQIRCLRVYHETSTVAELARTHSKST